MSIDYRMVSAPQGEDWQTWHRWQHDDGTLCDWDQKTDTWQCSCQFPFPLWEPLASPYPPHPPRFTEALKRRLPMLNPPPQDCPHIERHRRMHGAMDRLVEALSDRPGCEYLEYDGWVVTPLEKGR